ncbi:MAG: type secretion protein, partial [Nocardioides sp.]|nr:type secretion protein [Nocardioides sp.]
LRYPSTSGEAMPLAPRSTSRAQRSSTLRSTRSAGAARTSRRWARLRNTDRSNTTRCLTTSSSATGSAASSSKRFNCIRARADTAGPLTRTRSRLSTDAAMTAPCGTRRMRAARFAALLSMQERVLVDHPLGPDPLGNRRPGVRRRARARRRRRQRLADLALIGLMVAFAGALVLRAAATVAAMTTGADAPEGGIAGGLRVLTDPGRPSRAFGAPGLSALAYWSVVTLFIGVLAALAWCVSRLVARLRHRSARDPHRIRGTATARDVDAPASKKALVRRAATLRPSIQHPSASDVGYLIGRSCGREIWASVEDSILVIGPPRSGKGTALRHQRHPRRPRRSRHHLHAARQHLPHHRRPQRTRPGRRIRPTTPDRGTACDQRQRCPLVADPRL